MNEKAKMISPNRHMLKRQGIDLPAHGKDITELESKTVIFFKVHKSSYRHMVLWLEIDFIRVYFEGYYGTGMEAIAWNRW
ncbi:MAG: hypothetical protein HFI28_05135 [Lachnospiraceae bacterium]|nr:hypothetical protein [Lachnospiraceae bacterium]